MPIRRQKKTQRTWKIKTCIYCHYGLSLNEPNKYHPRCKEAYFKEQLDMYESIKSCVDLLQGLNTNEIENECKKIISQL